ncbi:MAG: transporter [Gammaproteobacteria bacterium]|jgi:hypothetical protein|nr:transporter [Gammaproteobacteria bacterium]
MNRLREYMMFALTTGLGVAASLLRSRRLATGNQYRSTGRHAHALPVLVGVWLVLCSNFVLAESVSAPVSASEQPLQEVFQSELVYPQEAGEVQVTFAPQFHDGAEAKRWELPVTVEYGVTDDLQVELEWKAYVRDDRDDEPATDGIGDIEIGLQYSWMRIKGSRFHAAAGVEVGIPTGDEDKQLGEGDASIEPYGIFAADLPDDRGQLFVHAGIEFSNDVDEPFVNIGGFVPMGDVVVTAEWNWSEEQRFLTPGLVWQSEKSWEFGIGVPIGLNDASDDYRVIVLAIYEIN